MKIEFKKTTPESTFEEVFVNTILEGKFCFDETRNAFFYVPNLGNEILLAAKNDEDARQELIRKLPNIYH